MVFIGTWRNMHKINKYNLISVSIDDVSPLMGNGNSIDFRKYNFVITYFNTMIFTDWYKDEYAQNK